MKKIGVFDSGIGGRSVADALEVAIPDASIVFVSDSENLPYGTKTPDELKKLVAPKIDKLINQQVDCIVIACNTVSTTIIDYIRGLTNKPVIGVEPMIREAVQLSKSGIITVCATPTTLSSKRYKELKESFASRNTVIEPDCSRWTQMIEDNQVDRDEIFDRINTACEQGADVIVLGCTHYHWIEDLIGQIADDRAVVVQPTNSVISKVKDLLANS